MAEEDESRPEASRPHEEEASRIAPAMHSPLLAADSPQQRGSLLLQPQSPESADSSAHIAEDGEPLKKGTDVPFFGRKGYAPLSKEQPMGLQPTALPAAAPRWSCGQQRLHLRDSFNSQEISALQILKNYDLDNSGCLDTKELKHLLTDYSSRENPVTEDELNYIMLVADKNQDQSIDQTEIFFGLRSWYAWNHMPKSVGAAFTRYKVGQGLPMPSIETLHEAMLTLNESQPVENAEVQYVISVAIHLGASAECATTDQMRKAIAAWYLNVERSESNTSDIAMASVNDAQKKINAHFSKLKSTADDLNRKFTIVDNAAQAAEGARQPKSGVGSEWPANSEEMPSTPADLRKLLQESPLWVVITVAAVLLLTVLPYMILVFVMWYKVATLQKQHTCEADLRLPLGFWVFTELSSWLFAVYCACVEKREGIKKCFGGILGLFRVCILIMGNVATYKAIREHCNSDLYDTSEFLFVYVPLFVLALACCAPICVGCYFIVPSLKSAKNADAQLSEMIA